MNDKSQDSSSCSLKESSSDCKENKALELILEKLELDLEDYVEEKGCNMFESDDYGQNFYGFIKKPTNLILTACKNWWGDCESTGLDKSHIFSPLERGVVCAQMIWAQSYQIGCAEVKCSPFNYFVCKYNPRGLKFGESFYEIGEPCTRCNDGCNSTSGLCL
uniref:SCP domain-containing protein n=1 Tax=Meloidogyne hapla TaxID=6305 RepID=A0A1I8B8X3_MELHA